MDRIDLSQHRPTPKPKPFIKTVMEIIERFYGQHFTCDQLTSVLNTHEEYSRFRSRSVEAVQQVIKDIRIKYPEFGLKITRSSKLGGRESALYVRPDPGTGEPEQAGQCQDSEGQPQ